MDFYARASTSSGKPLLGHDHLAARRRSVLGLLVGGVCLSLLARRMGMAKWGSTVDAANPQEFVVVAGWVLPVQYFKEQPRDS